MVEVTVSDDYIKWEKKAGGFRCHLCYTGIMNDGQISSHAGGQNHQRRLRAEDFRKLTNMQCEIEKLGLVRWRQHLKAEAYDYLLQSWILDGGSPYIPHSIEQQYSKYLKLEKISLLELAVWKASCLSFEGSGSFLNMQGILDHWALDESFDPVAYKSERRFAGSVAIIMQSVIGFLDG